MTKITITDYMERSAKGRACKARHTTYLVANGDFEKAYRTHLRRIAQGSLKAPYKTAGWSGSPAPEVDYVIL